MVPNSAWASPFPRENSKGDKNVKASQVKRCWYSICFSPRRSCSFLSFLQLLFSHGVQIIEVIGAKCKLLNFERVMIHIWISSHRDVLAFPQLPSFASFISNHLPCLSRLLSFHIPKSLLLFYLFSFHGCYTLSCLSNILLALGPTVV